MKPDASKQHKGGSVSCHPGTTDGPYCWNCELEFDAWEDAPPDLPTHFCSPFCAREWSTQQPLRNLLNKRRMKRAREGK